MAQKLTTFENALLQQFETLELACVNALETSEGVSARLRDLGQNTKAAFEQLAKRQAVLEQNQKKLLEALNAQIKLTETWQKHSEDLVTQVNALLKEQET